MFLDFRWGFFVFFFFLLIVVAWFEVHACHITLAVFIGRYEMFFSAVCSNTHGTDTNKTDGVQVDSLNELMKR